MRWALAIPHRTVKNGFQTQFVDNHIIFALLNVLWRWRRHHSGRPYPLGVTITPDGTRVYVANLVSGTVSVADTGTNTVVNTVFAGPSPGRVAITPDGTRLYVTSGASPTITILDTATNAVVGTIPVRFNSVGVVFTPDGARAYVEQRNEFLDVIDTATNTVVTSTLQALTFHDHLAITPDGARLYASSPVIKNVSVIDTSTNAVVNTIPLDDNPSFAAVISGGTRVLSRMCRIRSPSSTR